MRLGICSDIHGNGVALEAFLDSRRKFDVDKWFCLGDFCGYYPRVDNAIDLAIQEGWVCVLGNHDFAFLELNKGNMSPETQNQYLLKYGNTYLTAIQKMSPRQWEFLSSLKRSLLVKEDSLRMTLVHGTPQDELYGRLYPDSKEFDAYRGLGVDFVFQGHTHYPLLRKIRTNHGHLTIINPGSIGQPRDVSGVGSYAILDTLTFETTFVRFKFEVHEVFSELDTAGDRFDYSRKILEKLL